MSEYQVIARKWRPQNFTDVVGQEHVVRTLRNAISSGRTAHAYLFVGPRGIGKTTLARIFAKALNCEHPENGGPCCRCASCLELAADRSLDVMEIDAASRNSTTDMRELADNALTRPVSGKYKIYIIDEVHMLSKAAWNVLLKTVEEPPAHVKFIFATTEVHQVLPTIISRCQRFDLLPIPTKLIAGRLQLISDAEKVAINPAAIDAIARAAEGGMRDAQSLLDQMIAFFAAGDGTEITGEQVLSLFGLTDRNDMNSIIRAILQNNPGEVVTRIANLSRRGKNLETLFDDLLHDIRAIQLCMILADPSSLLDESPEAIAGFRELAKLAPRDTVQILLENLAPVGRTLHDALNKQVYLETILLKAMREAHAVRISDILARLNQLRSAGELQFIDQLPVVEKNFAVAVSPVAADEPAKTVEAVKEVVPEPVKPEPVIEKTGIEPVKEPEPIGESVADNTVVDEPEAVSEAVSASALDSALSDPVEEVVPAAAAVAEVIPEAEDISETAADDDITEADISADIPDESMQSQLYAIPGKESGRKKESFTPDKLQRSIANEHPEELISILKEDPVVQEVVDLFSGTVIDIHR
ncbi:MAG: DNA polymerase III subunit gamma/tau [Lentisphaeria bacterium]|nr:DNA polymerase III subunit gamma/tau [Lentisphaeria bacterium]